MPVVPEPYAPAAARARHRPVDALLDHLAGMQRARAAAPRRGDPLPPPRRLLRQRHGRLEGARRADRSRSARGWPRSAASATATSARPTRTGPTSSSRWPTAAPRRSATRSSTRSPPRRPASQDRATLYSLDRVQEDPPPVLHRRLPGLGARARAASERSSTVSLRGHPVGRALRARRRRACPAA